MTTCIDFETHAIESRPVYPPKPVGLAVQFPSRKKEYIAWGHPDSTDPHAEVRAKALVRAAWRGEYGPVLMHNASFDLQVAKKWAGVPLLPAAGFHDTQLLAFLHEPHGELKLKSLAEAHLGEPPEEQDRVRDYVLAQRKAKNPLFAGATKTNFGAYIAHCPEKLIAPYAKGDVSRTHKLFRFYEKSIGSWASAPYQTEKLLLPVIVDMESQGVRADVPGLRKLGAALARLRDDKDRLICKRLGYTFNVASGDQLAEALSKAGALTRATLTPTGKQSTARDTLIATCADKIVLGHLLLREMADKYVGTFIEPWCVKAEAGGGRIFPSFHQVRSMEGGTRTGRLASSSPNFQQVATNVEESRNADILKRLSAELVKYGIPNFTGLRAYILPDEGKLWASVDYSQQEIRMFAHYENGKLAAAYRADPELDVHAFCQQLIRDVTGKLYERKYVKTLVFGVMYGMGTELLAASTGLSVDDASKLKKGLYSALPGIRAVSDRCAKEGCSRDGMFTYGGRRYFVQDALLDAQNDVVREYGYKLLNVLVQGGCADMTKQAMLRVAALDRGRIALQIHDELCCQVNSKKDAQAIADAMCDLNPALNVPVLADIKMSKVSWGDVK